MAGFFEAWRRREAMRQAEEWADEREAAHRAVSDAPAEIRDELARAIETLLEGPDDEVERALDELWSVLGPYPELKARIAGLRVVDDAETFLQR
jgi:hypothetical protein